MNGSETHFANLMEPFLQDQRFHLLIGYQDQKPVATSLTFIDSNGSGGIYFIATEQFARKQGFGTMITSKAIQYLQSKGITRIILQATDLGKPIYEKLGFIELCRLGRYYIPGIN